MPNIFSSGELQNAFTQLLHTHTAGKQRLVVGYSGGVDSTLLVHLSRQYASAHGMQLLAVYLNHGDAFGTPTQSWQERNQKWCTQHGVALKIIQLALPTGNLENAARDARYQAFAAMCHLSDLVLLAHHLDDQHETLLAKLARGASLHGLLIPQLRPLGTTTLLRPLLRYNKAMLVACAKEFDLQWIEDPSNIGDGNTRAQIRSKLVPQLASIWQNWSSGWQASEHALEQAEQTLNYFCVRELKTIVDNKGIALAALAHLPTKVQQHMVITWLRLCGCRIPSRHTLGTQLPLLLSAKGTNTSILLTMFTPQGENTACLRLYQQRLWLYTPLPKSGNHEKYDWDGNSPITLQKSRLSCNRFCNQHNTSVMQIIVGRCECKVQLTNRSHHSELRKIMQQYGIPAWERADTPQLYWQGRLIALGDTPLCAQAERLALNWQPSWRLTTDLQTD